MWGKDHEASQDAATTPCSRNKSISLGVVGDYPCLGSRGQSTGTGGVHKWVGVGVGVRLLLLLL
jgi:hypothetical protein